VGLAKVLHSCDGRWRVEIHDDRRASLYDHGALIMRGTMEQLAQRLAELQVSADDLVED
jgi:hypothetical protein